MDQLIFCYTLFMTPMLLLSGVFFPLDALPATVQQVAWFLPLFHIVEVTRALLLGGADLAVLGHLAWLAGLLVLAFPVPVALLRAKLVR